MSDAAEVQRLVARMSPDDRRYHLDFTFAVFVGPVLSGFAFGALAPLAFAITLGRTVPRDMFPLLVGGSVVLSVAVAVFLRAYRRGSAVVRIDEQGIREHDGDHLRVDIPWSEARAWCFESRVVSGLSSVHLRFVGPSGDVIVLTTFTDAGLFPAFPFRSIARDHTLNVEHQIALALPQAADKPIDPRVAMEQGTGTSRFFKALVMLAGYAWVTGYVAVYGVDPQSTVFFHYDVPVRAFFTIFFGVPPLVLFVQELWCFERWAVRAALLRRASAAIEGDYRSAPRRPEAADPRTGYVHAMRRRARHIAAFRLAVLVGCVSHPWIAGPNLEVACHRRFPTDLAHRCPR